MHTVVVPELALLAHTELLREADRTGLTTRAAPPSRPSRTKPAVP